MTHLDIYDVRFEIIKILHLSYVCVQNSICINLIKTIFAKKCTHLSFLIIYYMYIYIFYFHYFTISTNSSSLIYYYI